MSKNSKTVVLQIRHIIDANTEFRNTIEIRMAAGQSVETELTLNPIDESARGPTDYSHWGDDS